MKVRLSFIIGKAKRTYSGLARRRRLGFPPVALAAISALYSVTNAQVKPSSPCPRGEGFSLLSKQIACEDFALLLKLFYGQDYELEYQFGAPAHADRRTFLEGGSA